MLLTSLNRVFTWGSNGSNGQLGSGETNFIVDSPYNITKNFNLLADEKITNIFMDNKKGAAITSLNRVFVWGYNVKNSISNQENLSLLLPVDVTNDFDYFEGEYITDVSLGIYHSLYLTNQGRVFERGDLKHYSEDYPGDNNTTIIDRTQEFNLSYDEFITNVYSNSFTSFVLTNEGSLFGWGYNTANLLLNEYSQEYPIYYSINKISDKITILEENEYIEKFSLSRSTAGIITNEGRVIMWGLANRGVLGKIIANDEHKNEPRAPGVVAVSNINELILTSNSSIALTNLGELSVWGAHSESLGVGSDYLITGPDTEAGLLVTKINFKRANDNFNELIAYGSDLELIISTKEGYLFDGWYRDNMFKEELTNQTMPAYNINLYGRWIEE